MDMMERASSAVQEAARRYPYAHERAEVPYPTHGSLNAPYAPAIFQLGAPVRGYALGREAVAARLSTGIILVQVGCKSATLDQWRKACNFDAGGANERLAEQLGILPFGAAPDGVVLDPATAKFRVAEGTKNAHIMDAFLDFVRTVFDEEEPRV